MRLLERQPTALPGSEVAQNFRLRLRAEGRVVDLPRGKTTIGSSARCNLRLQQPGVQPLHCLIVQEAEGLSVRRWGGDTLLNGEPFDESELAPGDCLRIASVEVEVVAPTAAPPTINPRTTPTIASATDDNLGGQLRVSRDLARTRSQKLLTALRRERAAHDLGLDQQLSDLQQQIEQIAAERSSVTAEHQQTLAELAEARRQAVEYQSLVAARQELSSQNERLGGEVRDLVDRVERLTRELGEVAAARQTLADEKAALAEEHKRLLDENSHLRDQEARQSQQVTTLCGERDQLREQNERLRADMQALGGEKATLADERASLCGERDQLRGQIEQLRADMQGVAAEKAALADERAALTRERDELRQQNEALRADAQTLASEKTTIAAERATLCGERDELRGQIEGLRSDLQAVATEKAALADERATLCGERDALRAEIERLRGDMHVLAAAKIAQQQEQAQLCGERDGYRRQYDRLHEDFDTLAAEKAALAEERAALCSERDRLRHENEQLQAGIAQLDEEILAVTTAKSAFEEERDRLRDENQRFADIERQMRSAVADRENMSGELYRALLQAAEMQKEVDQFDALAAAHQSLNEQHAELTDQLARLQEQTDRFDEERAAAASAQRTLAEETAAASEKRQRLADENAELLASLTEARQQLEAAARQRAEAETRLQQSNETWRQRLEEAQRSHAALAEKVARWERELAGKQQTEDAAIADAERQVADQVQRLADAAESVQQLEQQLAAAHEARRTLENERNEWQHYYSEATRQQQEQAKRIAELEAQLAAMAVAAPPENATSAATAANWGVESPSAGGHLDAETTPFPKQNADLPGDAAAQYAEPTPTESDWSAVPAESPHSDVSGAEDEAESFAAPDTAEATTGGAGLRSQTQETEHVQGPAPADEADASQRPVAKRESTSYIERYAHLFTDENPANEQTAAPAPAPPLGGGIEKSRRMNVVSRSTAATPSASAGDEESIEQYMSKLLQRVRGQSAGSPTTHAQHTAAVPNGPLSYQPMLPGDPTAGTADEPNPSTASKFTWASFDAARSKSLTPAPKTDLEALRALANESARRAISRHSLRKHRRNALTKVIVSTLAGVTSLWLILESPDWRTLQSITACVALLVAAYWAGQTYRALLDALREKPADELEEDVNESVAGFQSPLPIDVDKPASVSDE